MCMIKGLGKSGKLISFQSWMTAVWCACKVLLHLLAFANLNHNHVCLRSERLPAANENQGKLIVGRLKPQKYPNFALLTVLVKNLMLLFAEAITITGKNNLGLWMCCMGLDYQNYWISLSPHWISLTSNLHCKFNFMLAPLKGQFDFYLHFSTSLV